eukprot:GFUD01007351.1.p1 GENE.GFUD01007351.1~~GFUD01007351.1.p1  ORF type:complete len:168 (+),score=30.24 GFUD01007351.1:62-505(+)
MVEEVKNPAWTRPISRLYQYNRDTVGSVSDFQDMIFWIDQKDSCKPRAVEVVVDEFEETKHENKANLERQASSTSSSSIKHDTLSQEDVDEFLERSYAQQIRERNTIKIHERGVRAGFTQFSGAVTPIISSATNIRDFYIRSIACKR